MTKTQEKNLRTEGCHAGEKIRDTKLLTTKIIHDWILHTTPTLYVLLR